MLYYCSPCGSPWLPMGMGNDKGPDSLLGLLWYHPSRQGHFITVRWEWKSRFSIGTVGAAGGWSGPLFGLLWHYSGEGHLVTAWQGWKFKVFTWTLLVGGDHIFFFLWCLAGYRAVIIYKFSGWLVCPFPVLWLENSGFFWRLFFWSVPVGISRLSPTPAPSPQCMKQKNKNKKTQGIHFHVVTQVPGKSAIFSPLIRVFLLFFSIHNVQDVQLSILSKRNRGKYIYSIFLEPCLCFSCGILCQIPGIISFHP